MPCTGLSRRVPVPAALNCCCKSRWSDMLIGCVRQGSKRPAQWRATLLEFYARKHHASPLAFSGSGKPPAGLRWKAFRPGSWLAAAIIILFVLVFAILMLGYGRLWFQAYMSNARVSLWNLVGMSLRQVNTRVILQGKIMALQAGVGNDPHTGITTRRLEAHYLAGGNVPGVISAIIAAHRADIDLDFDRAAAIDLAGRDVLEAVRTSVYPKVIDCPDPAKSKKSHLSAVARNGVELRIRARVTVRSESGPAYRRSDRRDDYCAGLARALSHPLVLRRATWR